MHSDMRIVLAFTVPAVAALLGLLWVLNNKRRPKGGKSDPAVKDAKLSSKSEGISTVSEPVASSFLKKNTACKAFKESPQESSEIVSHDATCYEGGKNSCLGMMNLQHVHNIPLDCQDILSSINVTVTPTNSIVKLTNSGTCLPLQIVELSETGCSSKNEVKLNESHELSGRKYVEMPSFSVGSSVSLSEDGTGHLKPNIPTIAVEKTKSGDAEGSALLTQETSMESWDVAQLIPSSTVLTPSAVTNLMITNEVDVSEVDKCYPGDIATDSDISLAHQQMEATSEVMCFGPLDLGEEKKEDAGEVDTVVQSFPTSPYIYNVRSDFSENACSVSHIAPSSSKTLKQLIDASLDSTASCDANKNIEAMEINQEKPGPSQLLTCKKCDTSLGIQDERTSISGIFQDLSAGRTSFHSEDDVGKPDCSMGLCQTGVKEMLETTNISDPSVSSFSFMFRNTAFSHDSENTHTDISNSLQDQASIEGTDCSRTCYNFTRASTNNAVISGDDVSRTDTFTGHISVIMATELPATESVGNYFSIGGNSYNRELNDTDTMAKANLSVYDEDVADHLLLSQKHFVSNRSSSPLENKEREKIVSSTPHENITAQRTGHSEWQQDLLSTCTVDLLVSKESASATENNLGAGSKSDDLILLETKLLSSDPFHFTDNSSFTCVENIVSENDDLLLSETQEPSSLKEAREAMLNDIFRTQLHTSSTYVPEESDSVRTTELPLDDELLHKRDDANKRPMLSVFKETSSVPAKTVSSHIISLEPGGENYSENNLDSFNELSSLPCEKPYSDDLLNIHQDRPFVDAESCSSLREALQLTVVDEQPATIMEPHLQPFAMDKQNEHCTSSFSSNLKASVMDQNYEKDTLPVTVFQQSFQNEVDRSKIEEVTSEACETALGQTVTDAYKQVVTETKLEPIVTDTHEQVLTVCETNLEKTVLNTSKQLVANICETELKQTVTDVAEQADAYVCETEFEQSVVDTGEQAVCDSCETGLEQTVIGENVVTDVGVAELEQAVKDAERQIVTNVCETKLVQIITDTPKQVVTDDCETKLEKTVLDTYEQETAAICEPYCKQTVTEIAEQANANVCEIQLEQAVIDMSGQVTDVCETKSEQIEIDVPEQVVIDVCRNKLEENILDTHEKVADATCETKLQQTATGTHEQVVAVVCETEFEQTETETCEQTVTDVHEPCLEQTGTGEQVVTDNCETDLEETVAETSEQTITSVCEADLELTVTGEQVVTDVCETNLEQNVTDAYKQVVTETKLELIVTDTPEQVVTDVCETNLEKTVLDTSKQLVADICETELKQTVTNVAEQADAYVCETEFEQSVVDTGEQAVCDSCEAGLEQTVIGEHVVTDVGVAELEQAVKDAERQIVTNVCETKLVQIITDTPKQVVTDDCETKLEKTVLDTYEQEAAAICEPYCKQTVTDIAEQANANVCEIQLEQAVIDMSGQVTDVCETKSEQIEIDVPEQVVIDVCRNKLEENILDTHEKVADATCETKLQQTATGTHEQIVALVCETEFEQTVIDTHKHAVTCETEFEQTETETCEQTVSDAHEADLDQTVTNICEQVKADICEIKLKFVSDKSEQAVPSVCKADLGHCVADMSEQVVTDTFDNQEKQEATDICESYLEQSAMKKTDELIVSDCESKLEQSVVDKQDEHAAVDFRKSGLKQSVTYKQDEQVVMGIPELKKPLPNKQNDWGVFSVYESNFLQSGTEKLDEKTDVVIAESKKSILLGEVEQTVKGSEIKQSATDTSDEQTVLELDTIQLALNNHEQDNGLYANKQCRKAVMNASEHGFQQSLTDMQDKQVVFAVSESVGQHHTADEKDEHTALTIDVSFKFHEPAEDCPLPTSPDKVNSQINPLADGNSSSSVVLQDSKQQIVVSEHTSVVDGPASLQSLLTNSSWLSNDHSHPDTHDSQDQGNSSWLVVESEIKMDVEADLLSVKTISKDSPSSGLSQHKMANNHRKFQKKKAAVARSPKPSDPHAECKITGDTSSSVGKGKKAKSSTKPEKSHKNSSESFKSSVYSTSSSPGSDLKDRGHKASLMSENSLQPFSGFDRNNQHLEKGGGENESQSPKDSMQTECSAQLCNGNKQTDHCFQEAQEELSEQDWIGVQISNGSEHMELNATNMASSSSLVAASLVTVEFNFPTDLCGRLIGRNGRNVQHIKEQSGASVIITSNPVSPDFQLCRVQGLHSCVHEALMMIKKKFPQVDVQPILAPNLNPLIMPDMIKLNLPDGVSVKLVVSNIVNAGHIFVQLPNHPTFASLDRLCHCMNSCYTKNQGVPPLPRPVETGVICAAESGGCWFRVEIIGVYPETDECDIAYVDYGGYDRVALSSLRQIRSDFMTLPFQAIECYMANITPLQDEEYFSENAGSVLHELTAGKLLDGQVITREGSIPYIHLYQISTRGALLVNREMVNREVVRWIEIF